MAAKPPQLDEAEATKILMAGLKVHYDDLSEAQNQTSRKTDCRVRHQYRQNPAQCELNRRGGPIRRFFDRPVLENPTL
jgi:hypothetical protein